MDNQDILKGKSFKDLPDIGYVSPFVQDIFINSVDQNYSIHALRFIAILGINLKEKQHLSNNKGRDQLSLFDQMTDFTINSGLTFDLSFKYSDFLPRGNKNYNNVKKAIDELQNKMQTIEFNYCDKKGEVKKYKLRSALITAFITDESNGFKISINAYWYRVFINLTNHYNKYIKNAIFDLSHNGFIFYFYLQSLPKIEKDKINQYAEVLPQGYSLQPVTLHGTKKKTSDILNLLSSNRNLTKNYHIENRVLKPLRQELAKYTDIGFNYKIESENTVLVVYKTTHNRFKTDVPVSPLAKIKRSFEYKLAKAKLDYTQSYMFMEIYCKYPFDILSKATNRKSQLVGLTGKSFLDCFLLLVQAYTNGKEQQINTQEDKAKIKKMLLKLLKNDTYKSKQV